MVKCENSFPQIIVCLMIKFESINLILDKESVSLWSHFSISFKVEGKGRKIQTIQK